MFTQATAKVITEKYSLEQFSPHTELNDTNDDSDSMAISSSAGMDSNGEPNEEAPVDFYNKNKPPLNDLASNPHVGRLDGSDGTPSTEELGEHIAEVEEEKAQDINSATQSYAMQGMTMTADGIAVQGNMTEFRHSVETAGSGLIFNSGKDVKSGWVSDGKGTSAYMDEDGNIFDSNGWGFSDPDQSLWEVARDAAGSIIEAVRGVVEKVGQAVKDRNDETENDNTSGGSGYSTGPKSNEEKTPLDWGDDLPEEEDEAPRGDLTQEEWDAYVQEEWEKAYDEAIAAGKNKGEAEAYANAVAEAMEALAQSGGFAKGGSTATASNWSDPDYEPTYGFDPDESDDSDDSGSEEDDLAWLDEEDEESSGSGSTEGNGNTTETTPQESDPSTSGAEGGSSDDSRETNNDDPADSSSNSGTGTSTTSTGPSATTVSSTSTSPGNGWPGYGTTTSTTGKGTGSGTVSVSKPEPTQPKTQNTSQKPDTGAQENDQPQDTDSDALTKLQSLLSRLEELLEKLQQGDDLDPKKEIQGILEVLDAIKDADKSPWGDLLGGAGRSLQEALDSLNGPLFAEGGGGKGGGGGKPTPGREGTGLQGKPAESEGNQDNESDANNSDQPSSPKDGDKAPGVKPGNNPPSEGKPSAVDPTSPKAADPKTPSAQDPKKGPGQSGDGPKDSESEAEQPSSPKGGGKAPVVKPGDEESKEERFEKIDFASEWTEVPRPTGPLISPETVIEIVKTLDRWYLTEEEQNEALWKFYVESTTISPETAEAIINSPIFNPLSEEEKEQAIERLLEEGLGIAAGALLGLAEGEAPLDPATGNAIMGPLHGAAGGLDAVAFGATTQNALIFGAAVHGATVIVDGAGAYYEWLYDPENDSLAETFNDALQGKDIGDATGKLGMQLAAIPVTNPNPNTIGQVKTLDYVSQNADAIVAAANDALGLDLNPDDVQIFTDGTSIFIGAAMRTVQNVGATTGLPGSAQLFPEVVAAANPGMLYGTGIGVLISAVDDVPNPDDDDLSVSFKSYVGWTLVEQNWSLLVKDNGKVTGLTKGGTHLAITVATLGIEGLTDIQVDNRLTLPSTVVNTVLNEVERREGEEGVAELIESGLMLGVVSQAVTGGYGAAAVQSILFIDRDAWNMKIPGTSTDVFGALEQFREATGTAEAYDQAVQALADELVALAKELLEMQSELANAREECSDDEQPSGSDPDNPDDEQPSESDPDNPDDTYPQSDGESTTDYSRFFDDSTSMPEIFPTEALLNQLRSEGKDDGKSDGAIGTLRDFGFYRDQRDDESGGNENEDRGINLHLQGSDTDTQLVGVNFDFMYSDNF